MFLLKRKIVGFVLMLVLAFGLAGPAPAEAALISTKEEISIGRDVAKELEKKYGLADDPALQERIAQIGARLVAVCDRKELPYTFKVLNSKEVNALALPGGFIYVFKGLVDYMPSDDELAGVLGHELGHVVKRHSVRQMEKSLAVSLIFGAILGDRAAVLQNLAYNAIMAGYSRDDEREADYLGYLYSTRAGYSPYSMIMGMQKLADLEKKPSYGIFSSHPEPEARLGRLQAYIKKDNIRPQVIVTDKGAQVVDGAWQLPAFLSSYNNYKPVYRAYFTAGALYQVARRYPELSGDYFYLTSDDTNMTVYYDEMAITTLTPADAASHGQDLAAFAEDYVLKLREWAERRRTAATD
ncbi:M48 family metallopeptidase [Sporolituus thermophilus]|uniref:Peptidase family M48 n=1 Tax=Sporolituus thermophilus DSM 23256 TaxID=1123285 RepID=A0A1G7NXN5_9FIRM|nr:M48 family metallopeptidase [Sporolituus thermophilus]SDF78129.1 Peptidase family M48 [Sporolituus thermophilus DSM 23256]